LKLAATKHAKST